MEHLHVLLCDQPRLHERKGRIWVRLCGQIYNDASDLDRLIRAVEARVKR